MNDYIDYADLAARELQQAIDYEIMRDLLVGSCGYTSCLVAEGWTDATISLWLKGVGINEYVARGREFLIKDPRIATAFILKFA